MNPREIHDWCLKYKVDPAFVWEALEMTTGFEYVLLDEMVLMDNLVKYIVGTLEMLKDDQAYLVPYLTTFIPMVHTLGPFLSEHHKSMILDTADDVGGFGTFSVTQAVLYPPKG